MTRSSLKALLLALAATGSGSTLYNEETGTAPGVVSFDIRRRDVADRVHYDRNRLLKRAGTLDLTVDNAQTLYFLNASLGTPQQPVQLHVDTGSSDLWVNTPDSSYCSSSDNPCETSGTYSANSSSSSNYLNSAFNITYADGSGASGDYVSDILRLPGAQVSNFQFGVGYLSSSDQNILGIGYPTNEVQATKTRLRAYNNLPLALVSGNVISRNIYSLWLDDLQSNTGRLLFGGVDTSRFRGNLTTLPVQKTGKSYSAFFITMTGLSVNSKSLTKNLAIAVLLDSGTSLTYLPNDLTSAIYRQLNVTYQPTQGAGFIPCSAAQNSDSLTFRFSDPASITVPINELVLSLGNTTSQQEELAISGNDPICLFGIAPSSDSTIVLGDTFMRSAYVVYDLDNNQVSIAQSNINATGSGNVVQIQKGTALPSAVMAQKPVPAASGLPSVGGKTNGAPVPILGGASSVPLARIMALVAIGFGHFL